MTTYAKSDRNNTNNYNHLKRFKFDFDVKKSNDDLKILSEDKDVSEKTQSKSLERETTIGKQRRLRVFIKGGGSALGCRDELTSEEDVVKY